MRRRKVLLLLLLEPWRGFCVKGVKKDLYLPRFFCYCVCPTVHQIFKEFVEWEKEIECIDKLGGVCKVWGSLELFESCLLKIGGFNIELFDLSKNIYIELFGYVLFQELFVIIIKRFFIIFFKRCKSIWIVKFFFWINFVWKMNNYCE